MYSEEDINSAVAAGALSAEAAANLRNHVAATRELPRVDEENFRLVNSFNDIFVAIGVVILLLAAGAIGQQLAGLFVATPALAGQNPTDAEFSSYLGKRAAYDGELYTKLDVPPSWACACPSAFGFRLSPSCQPHGT